MAVFTVAQGTRSSSVLNLGTLAANTYVASTAQDLTATIPEDVVVEVECDPNGTPSGNKQLVVFVQLSLDNSNFSTGPTSGTTATEEGDLYILGVLPTVDTNTHRKMFSFREAGIPVARYFKVVCKNDLGVALTSGNAYKADITGAGT